MCQEIQKMTEFMTDQETKDAKNEEAIKNNQRKINLIFKVMKKQDETVNAMTKGF